MVTFSRQVNYKDDSMDFYSGNIAELLDKPNEICNIVDLNGKIIGKHNGFWHYTIGQRHGLNISSSEPMYVIDIKTRHNTIVVGTREQACKTSFKVKDIHWTNYDPKLDILVGVKIRSAGHNEYFCKLYKDGTIECIDENNQMFGVAPGQFAVFYSCEMVVGSGVIC